MFNLDTMSIMEKAITYYAFGYGLVNSIALFFLLLIGIRR